MKPIPSVFRRRKISKSTAEAAAEAAAIATPPPDKSTIPSGQVNTIYRESPSIKVIQFAEKENRAVAATVPPPTIGDKLEAAMKTHELVQLDNDAVKTTDDVNSKSFGTDHYLSTREQMWYKNQMYLLAKKQQHASRGIMSRVEFIDNGEDCNNDGMVDGHRYSPRGVNEFEPSGVNRAMTQFVSKMEVQPSQSSRSSSDYDDDDDDDDTRTISRKLLECDESCTTQYSSLLDDDMHTHLSSILFEEEDSCTDTSELFEGVALDSATMESESLLASQDDGTSMSYIFEFVDDYKQRRKYKLGVGQNPATFPKKFSRSATKSTKDRSRRKKNATVDTNDANFAEVEIGCPLLPEFLEEVSGTYKDAKLALNQVLYAFCISHDDVHRISDKVEEAKIELIDICNKRESM